MKILVVDDETDVKMLFVQCFRHEIKSGEMQFSFAYSGEEALAFLQQHYPETILILSDINMPGMSGLELLRHIRQAYEKPAPVVMMLTAYGDASNYQQAFQSGADDFLTKPVDFVKLKDILKSKLYDQDFGS